MAAHQPVVVGLSVAMSLSKQRHPDCRHGLYERRGCWRTAVVHSACVTNDDVSCFVVLCQQPPVVAAGSLFAAKVPLWHKRKQQVATPVGAGAEPRASRAPRASRRPPGLRSGPQIAAERRETSGQREAAATTMQAAAGCRGCDDACGAANIYATVQLKP
jgi:hypothetical protein